MALVFGADLRRQIGSWEERVAVGKAHAGRAKIAPCKMGAADPVVIGFDAGIFGRTQHGGHFRLSRQLEQVVIVPGVSSNGLAVALEQFHFGVDGE